MKKVKSCSECGFLLSPSKIDDGKPEICCYCSYKKLSGIEKLKRFLKVYGEAAKNRGRWNGILPDNEIDAKILHQQLNDFWQKECAYYNTPGDGYRPGAGFIIR